MNGGYSIVDQFLTKEEHEYYLNVCNETYNQTKGKYHPSFSWNSPGNLNKINGACDYQPKFLELASHPILVNRAKEILGTNDTLDVYISKFFPMMPGVGMSTFMHQDNYYFQGDPTKMVSCAVYLEDTSKENGCLRLVEDSHKHGIMNHNIVSDVDPWIRWIDESDLESFNILDLERNAPYAAFFDINLVHGCYPNVSDRTRYSLAWEYIPTSESSPIDSNEAWCDRNIVG
jgi:hypothetical protein